MTQETAGATRELHQRGEAGTKRKGDQARQGEATERQRSAEARQQPNGEGISSQLQTVVTPQRHSQRRQGRQARQAGTETWPGTKPRKVL